MLASMAMGRREVARKSMRLVEDVGLRVRLVSKSVG